MNIWKPRDYKILSNFPETSFSLIREISSRSLSSIVIPEAAFARDCCELLAIKLSVERETVKAKQVTLRWRVKKEKREERGKRGERDLIIANTSGERFGGLFYLQFFTWVAWFFASYLNRINLIWLLEILNGLCIEPLFLIRDAWFNINVIYDWSVIFKAHVK